MGLTRIRAQQITDIDYKQAVRVVTSENVTLDGGAPNQVDGVNLSTGNRILVNGQTNKAQNGLYQVETVGAGSSGVWVRTNDGNTDGEIDPGMLVMVTEGTTYADTLWKLVTNGTIQIGITELTFVLNTPFGFGNVYANSTGVVATAQNDVLTLSPGDNITIVGNAAAKSIEISLADEITGNLIPSANVTYDLGSSTNRWRDIWLSNSTIYLGDSILSAEGNQLLVDNQPVITSTTPDSLTLSGNVVGGNISGTNGTFTNVSGNGAALTAINGANVTGTVANSTYSVSAGSATSATTAGTVTTTAQPNITSVGTLTSLSVTGNVTSGNVSGTTGAFTTVTGNGRALTSLNASNLDTGTVPTARLSSIPNSSLANSSITINGTEISLGSTGTITAAAAAENLTGTTINSSVVNSSLTSVGTLTSLAVTGNVTSGNVSGTTGAFTNVSGNGAALTSITGANVTGTVANATYSVSAGSATTAGTVTTAAQPNITSVGTLTSLAVTGNVTSGNVSGTTGAFTTVTGNGRALTSLNATNIDTGTLPAARLSGTYTITVSGAATTAGTVTTAAQPNITSVGTLTSLTVNGLTTHTGNVDVTGNINVTGNLNYANVTDLVVGDPLIYIGQDNPGNLYDLGIVVSWNDGTYQHGGWVRDATDGTWKLFGNVVSEPTTVVDFTNATYQPMRAGAITATTGSFSGNVTSGNISGTTGAFTTVTGNGRALTSINASNIDTGTLPAARLSGTYTITVSGAATTAGTVTTAAQPNITSVGTLTSLAVTGNVTSGNVSGTTGAFTNVSGNGASLTGLNASNIASGTLPSARLSGTYTITVSGAATTAGTVTTAAQPNITSVGTLTSLAVTGNVTSGNVSGTTGAFTTVTGNGRALTSLNASNIDTGTLAQARLANSSLTVNGTSISLGGSGTVTANTPTSLTFNNSGVGAASGTTFNGSAAQTISYNTVGAPSTSGTNATGTWGISISGSASTVTTAAQPNITSVGTLTSIITSGAITANGNNNYSYQFGHGNYSRVILPAANNGASTGDAGLYFWISEPGVTWTGAGIARNRRNDNGSFSRINASLSGQMIRFDEGTSIIFSSQNTSNVNYTPLTLTNNDATVAGTLTVNSNIVTTGSGGNITGANVVSATTISTTQILNSGSNGIGNIGSSSSYFNTVFAKATSAQYADLAEMYVADAAYPPGTVVEFGGEAEITITTESTSTRVIGIVSTNPSYLMNSTQKGNYVLPVALIGRVPCQVKGPVCKGDVLVSSDIPGVAQKIGSVWHPGCTLGKAMENIDESIVKTIEVAVGRF